MSQNLDPNMVMIVILILFIFMMWMSSRRMKKQQKQQQEELREAMVPGTLVVLRGGIIATIVSVDEKYEEVVVDSEGSRLRFKLNAVAGKYVRPAFIDDETSQDDAQQDDASDADAENESDAAPAAEGPDIEPIAEHDATSADDAADATESAEADEAAAQDGEQAK
ncbi:preprotein translocase subunit YajC [Bifidobacterium apri]|uniref:preprotein translocase subunit YajC n=1 Tax=Bifidobacterium apri TaxID=1769423 RepID=UPI003996B56A